MRRRLVRAFDSYTSTDGGSTWSAPSGGATPQLPPASFATTPGGDVPLFVKGSATTYATNVDQVLGTSGAGTFNPMWCLDGYAAYVAGAPDTSGTGGVPKVWLQADYSATPFYGYTKLPVITARPSSFGRPMRGSPRGTANMCRQPPLSRVISTGLG